LNNGNNKWKKKLSKKSLKEKDCKKKEITNKKLKEFYKCYNKRKL